MIRGIAIVTGMGHTPLPDNVKWTMRLFDARPSYSHQFLCGAEADIIVSNVELPPDTLLYALSRLRNPKNPEGYHDLEAWPISAWRTPEGGFVRIGEETRKLDRNSGDLIDWIKETL